MKNIFRTMMVGIGLSIAALSMSPTMSAADQNNHVSIDSTYRFSWLENVQSKDQNIKNKSIDDNGHMITAGLNFHF